LEDVGSGSLSSKLNGKNHIEETAIVDQFPLAVSSLLMNANVMGPALQSSTTPTEVVDSDTASTSTETEIESPNQLKYATIEVFSGSARLTKALSDAGFDAVGIDYRRCKDKPVGKTLWMDLTEDAGANEFQALVERLGSRLVYVHFAPPCGTASRAREKRLRGALDPKPLRSEEYPDGLPDLEGDDLNRVLAANKLYKFTANAFAWLAKKGVACTIENPTNSLMWDTKPFCKLGVDKQYGFPNYRRHTMQMCMHGGARPKFSDEISFGKIDFSSLEKLCHRLIVERVGELVTSISEVMELVKPIDIK